MESEIAKRRRIDGILSPPIREANKLATELKIRSDVLKIKMAQAEAAVALSKSRMNKFNAVKRATKLKLR